MNNSYNISGKSGSLLVALQNELDKNRKSVFFCNQKIDNYLILYFLLKNSKNIKIYTNDLSFFSDEKINNFNSEYSNYYQLLSDATSRFFENSGKILVITKKSMNKDNIHELFRNRFHLDGDKKNLFVLKEQISLIKDLQPFMVSSDINVACVSDKRDNNYYYMCTIGMKKLSNTCDLVASNFVRLIND